MAATERPTRWHELLRGAAGLGALAAVVLTAACSGGSGSSQAPTTTTEATTTTTSIVPLEQGEQNEVYVPAVGDCLDRRLVEQDGGGHVPVVLVFDCSLPHTSEVFAVLQHPGAGSAYPGDEVMRTYARSACIDEFEAYVGQVYELSELDVDHHIPSAADWERGARSIGCSLVSISGERLTGSARGSGR